MESSKVPNKVEYILYKSSNEGDRKMAICNGYAIYQSTGTNSGFPGTWFPFLGIADPYSNNDYFKRCATIHGAGYIIKAKSIFRNIPGEIEEKGKELGLTEDFFYRIGNLACLLLSAQINNGFWNTACGSQFKCYLQEKYSQLSDNILFEDKPSLIIPVNELAKVNSWLLANGALKVVTPQLMEELDLADKRKILQFSRGQKPIKIVTIEDTQNHEEVETSSCCSLF
jgi:hypothetical protein